jgi:predicted Asp-tRNA(Asn)/Glu-tRNA(Gln) amidotransferase subunit C
MTNNFTWHEVTKKEKQQIQKDAKKLLNEFSKKLTSIKGVEEHFTSSISENGQREQGDPWKTDPEFRDLFFLNAPFVENEFIVAEKGSWRK